VLSAQSGLVPRCSTAATAQRTSAHTAQIV
jgi:hypothetical protein